MHRRIMIGAVREPQKCQACGERIEAGERAAYHPEPPRGPLHMRCHERDRYAEWTGTTPGQLQIRGVG
jgi:hypothetical protein